MSIDRNDEAKTLLKDITESRLAIQKSKKKAKAPGLKPLLLEDKGERVGRGRIFRPVRDKQQYVCGSKPRRVHVHRGVDRSTMLQRGSASRLRRLLKDVGSTLSFSGLPLIHAP